MRNKKEKTPNNVLKSPLRVAVKQSCSLEEEEDLQSVVSNSKVSNIISKRQQIKRRKTPSLTIFT